jgi:O-antigen/teichoic acid export membrane protein
LMVTINLIKALLVSVLKGSWTAWVQEVWLKASYLILAVLLLSDFIGLETMVYAYVGTWCVAVFLMLLAALRMKIPVRLSGLKDLNWRYHFKYGGYSALAGGAVTIATNLDFVMVGALLGLSVVPEYTMGFFIGAIVLLPQRALHTVYSGLISSKMKEARDEVVPLIRQTSRVNILLAVTMFVGIWAGLDPLVSALPVAYKNISGIVLAIGLQKVIFSMSYASSQVISFTKHFRLNLPINIGLVIMTALLNWLFMSYFGWGVTGAALATLFTGAWNASWHLGVMYRKVGMHAFSWSWLAIILAGAAIGIPFKWIATGWLGHGYLEALIQGGAASLALMLFAYFTGLFPELRTAVQIHIWGRFK